MAGASGVTTNQICAFMREITTMTVDEPDEIAPKVDRLDRQEDEIGGSAKVRSARTVRQR